jgi:hypothetical protein
MISTIALLAGCTVAATLVTGARVFGLRKITKHATKVDVAFTAGAAFAFAGTLTGFAAAILAGLFMALVLSALKAMYAAKDAMAAKAQDVSERYKASAPQVHIYTPNQGWTKA